MSSISFFISFLFLSVGLNAQRSTNCGSWNFRKHFRCLFKELIFAKDLALLNLNNTQDIQRLQGSCDALQVCYSSMECQNMNTIELTNKMKAACEGLLYIFEEHSDCSRKIENIREKCKPRTSCANMFGEKNCGRDLIIERCSKEEWVGFRNSMIKLMTVADPMCDLDQYRKL
uniref:DUF19 domain-containing protein n=2 Tax=Caenorhabditis tropicalis TaxID=1561998 RepID=A0A1I7V2A8_9PELO